MEYVCTSQNVKEPLPFREMHDYLNEKMDFLKWLRSIILVQTHAQTYKMYVYNTLCTDTLILETGRQLLYSLGCIRDVKKNMRQPLLLLLLQLTKPRIYAGKKKKTVRLQIIVVLRCTPYNLQTVATAARGVWTEAKKKINK